jgi:hypothetical protein
MVKTRWNIQVVFVTVSQITVLIIRGDCQKGETLMGKSLPNGWVLISR